MKLTQDDLDKFREVYGYLFEVVEAYQQSILGKGYAVLQTFDDDLALRLSGTSITIVDAGYGEEFSMPIEELFRDGDLIANFKAVKIAREAEKLKYEKEEREKIATIKRDQTLLKTLAAKYGYELRKMKD